MLRSFVNDERDDWDQYLHWACFAYRSSEIESCGYTPFMMLQGREPRSVLDINETNYTMMDSPTEWTKRMIQQVRRINEIVSERNIEERKQTKQRSQGRPLLRLKEGDQVLVRSQRQPHGLGRKLAAKWEGPYAVIKMTGKKTAEVAFGGRRGNDLVSTERVKLYTEKTEVYDEDETEDEEEEEKNNDYTRKDVHTSRNPDDVVDSSNPNRLEFHPI
jgi:hypothetical protein